jgi:HSP20 family protein
MAILRRDGNQNQQGQQRNDPNALARPGQPELVRDPFQMMRNNPFQLMREMMMDPFRLFQQMSPWGDVIGREGREGRELVWSPSFEVRETDDGYVFKGDMPGVKQEDLEISLVGNNIQITGKREREQEIDEGTYHSYERSYGQFTRSFALPEVADLDKVRCDLKDGVLTLVVPKKAGTAPQRRRIQIGSGSKS